MEFSHISCFKTRTVNQGDLAYLKPPIEIYRPLDGELLQAFEHMVDALTLLDFLGESDAAGALMTAIAIVTSEPKECFLDERTNVLFLQRYEDYLFSVSQKRISV